MPIRNRAKPDGLKLVIPERQISPRDWSRPYQRRPGSKWKFAHQQQLVQQQRQCVFRFTETAIAASSVTVRATVTAAAAAAAAAVATTATATATCTTTAAAATRSVRRKHVSRRSAWSSWRGQENRDPRWGAAYFRWGQQIRSKSNNA